MSIRNPRILTVGGVKFTYHHIVIFILTFLTYALFHATRKTFSNVKTTISEHWIGSCEISDKNDSCVPMMPDDIWNSHHLVKTDDAAKIFLGELDAIFLAAYSIGLFISGMLGDRFNLRIVLFIGMMITSITLFMFGVVSEWLGVYNKAWYVIFWIINGFAQSTGWPAVVAVMGNWFSKTGRGLIFGAWSACASVGNIIGALMVAKSLSYGYQYSFIVTSSVLFSGGIIVFFSLVPSPEDIGLPDPNEDSEETPVSNNAINNASDSDSETLSLTEPLIDTHKESKPIGFFQALFLPGVIMYSLCYACLKMINYSFLFWLPFYLSNAFGWKEEVADEISIWYDVGGIIGGIIGGFVSDLIKKRSIVIFVLLTFAIPSLFIFSNSSDSKALNAFLMAVAGFFVGGAANIISATITADLGQQEALKGSKEGLATVTGIVDGTGSVGAAIGQLLVPVIQTNYDWHYVFYLFIVLCFFTNLCILPLFIRECQELYRILRYRGRSSNLNSFAPNIDYDEDD